LAFLLGRKLAARALGTARALDLRRSPAALPKRLVRPDNCVGGNLALSRRFTHGNSGFAQFDRTPPTFV
jgi:hypothetical protein